MKYYVVQHPSQLRQLGSSEDTKNKSYTLKSEVAKDPVYPKIELIFNSILVSSLELNCLT